MSVQGSAADASPSSSVPRAGGSPPRVRPRQPASSGWLARSFQRLLGDTSGRPDGGEGVESQRALVKWVILGSIIGVVAGVGAIIFFYSIEWVTVFFLHWIVGYYPPGPIGEGEAIVRPIARPWLFPIVTTIGGLLAGIIVFSLAPEARGHGTDAAIESFHHRGGRVRRRIPAVKLIASALTIGSGGSGGREGPTAQISSGFGSFLADVLGLSAHDRRIALATGMGSGIGAIFRAPLGGAMMAAEIMYRHDMEVEVLIPSLIASIVGYSIYGWWTGWEPIFGTQANLGFNDPFQLVLYAVLGLLSGGLGILYARTFYFTEHVFDHLHIPRMLKPALGGLLVGLMGIAIPEALHTGYGWSQIGMDRAGLMGMPLLLILVLPFAKILATSLSIGSGGSGGIFGPGMVIGSLLGSAFWRLTYGWIPGVPPSPAPFAIVGMMAMFGSVAHAPLAVMLMVAEMTGNLSLLAPAMIALGLAMMVVGDVTMYTSQLRNRSESPAHRYRFSFPLLTTLPVRTAMVPPPAVLHGEVNLLAAEEALMVGGVPSAPVLNDKGIFMGIVSATTIARVPVDQRGTVTVADLLDTASRAVSDKEAETASKVIAQASPPVPGAVEQRPPVVAKQTAGASLAPRVSPSDTLDVALQQMAESELSWIPVVEPGSGRLLGVLTVAAALSEYRAASRRGVRRIGALVEGTTLVETRVEVGAPLAWRPLAEAGLPSGVVVMALRRHGEAMIPRGNTVLQPGDTLTLVVTPSAEASLQQWLVEHNRPAPAATTAVTVTTTAGSAGPAGSPGSAGSAGSPVPGIPTTSAAVSTATLPPIVVPRSETPTADGNGTNGTNDSGTSGGTVSEPPTPPPTPVS